jgi:hypothetical protein
LLRIPLVREDGGKAGAGVERAWEDGEDAWRASGGEPSSAASAVGAVVSGASIADEEGSEDTLRASSRYADTNTTDDKR